jgi:cyanophycinase-like exopeptidase
MKKNGKGYLVAVGGGETGDITEDSLKIIEKFLELSGGLNKAKIIVMTVATDNPEGAEERYKEVFDRLKFKNFEFVDIADRSESYDESITEALGSAFRPAFFRKLRRKVSLIRSHKPLIRHPRQ